ncbi:hypothetical protein PVA45_04220 [Entomospira entomophila]|uniref:Uncharacterized protein n=1 Tax=Entomospira entomophila TaxID=2719988 RepID=A0A968GE13_9SPIO|nr:hypothetical protein [Entomospira entomophilus]NIZ40714.1 hypothetical protein [Entomospira entomophilus]WDI34927.1 hypothetical protein PVA45_04220 [Entomospira entomophilus]
MKKKHFHQYVWKPKNYLLALLYLLLAMIGAGISFWIAPAIANQANNLLLLVGGVLFFLGAIVIIFSGIKISLYVQSFIQYYFKPNK